MRMQVQQDYIKRATHYIYQARVARMGVLSETGWIISVSCHLGTRDALKNNERIKILQKYRAWFRIH